MLSSEAIENFQKKEYEFYNKLIDHEKITLTKDQQKVSEELLQKSDKFRVHLLQGTTGSGKTIVYFNAIKKK